MSAIHASTTREWKRFTPAERLGRYAVYFCIVAAVVISAQAIEIIPEFLVDMPEQFADMRWNSCGSNSSANKARFRACSKRWAYRTHYLFSAYPGLC